MKLDLKFKENAQRIDLGFGQYQDLSDGGFERGYAEGYEVGEQQGFENFVNERSFILTGAATIVPDWGFQNINCEFEIDLPYLTTIRGGGFYGCKKLTKANFPLVTTTSGSDFNGCVALTDINLPLLHGVSTYAFKGCTSLNTVDFPLVKDIWGCSFEGCTSLETLILRLPTMCTLRYVDALVGTPIESGTGYIYVPKALVEQYKTATNWSAYASQIRAIEDYPEICG